MIRRGRGGWDDYEMERRMEEIEERRGYSDDYVLYVFIGIAFGIAAILAGLGWLDNQFGLGTVAWFKDLIGLK